MLPGLRPRPARQRAFARLHAAGQSDGGDRRGAAPAALVPHRPAVLSALRAGAARPCGRSRHHLPAGISLHQRNHQAVARQFRRALHRGLGAARPCGGRPGGRHRLERRHAARQFQERRTPRARHRADRGRKDRVEPRDPDADALFHPRGGGRGQGRARTGADGDGGELLRAYRGRACDRRGHSRPARRRRRVHLGIALPHRTARPAAVRHHLSRASALLFVDEPRPSARHARTRGVPRAADPQPRRIDPRLRGAARHAPGERRRRADAGGGSRAATPCGRVLLRSAPR